jgi:hypothetical protein
MPFTFSHPAIVLPVTYLPKKWYSLSGLIMGSMTPDFEYFIRMKDASKYSHTWTGIFWFDVPLGLLLLFIFHNVVRNPLIENLPASLNRRLSAFEKFNWNQYFNANTIVVIISLIIGIASHLFWDSFTHSDDYFARTIPVLKETVNIFNTQVFGSDVLQYISSVVGGIVMIIAVFKLPEGKKTQKNTILNFWLLVSLIMISVFNLRLYIGKIFNYHLREEDIIVTIISGGLIGIIILSFFLKENKKPEIFSHLNKIRNK